MAVEGATIRQDSFSENLTSTETVFLCCPIQSLPMDIHRLLTVQGRVKSFVVVEVNTFPDAFAKIGCVIAIPDMNVIVFQCSEETFNGDIVDQSSFAIHGYTRMPLVFGSLTCSWLVYCDPRSVLTISGDP